MATGYHIRMRMVVLVIMSRNEYGSVWFDVLDFFFKELGILVSSKIPFVHLKCWLFLKRCKSQTDVLAEQTVTCKLLYGYLLPWMQGQLMHGSLDVDAR